MGNNKNGLYKYFDWLEHSVSTWFGVVKSFVFSLMRFAKKYFYSLIYSQSLSGFTKCDDMKDRTLPRVLVASFLSSHVEACYCHAINVSWVVKFLTQGCKII